MNCNNNKSVERKKLPVGALILIVIVIAITVFLCAAILASGDDSVPDTNNSQPSDTSAEPEPSERVLIENEVIKATYRGVVDRPDFSYFYVNLRINNNTGKEIWVTLESADVDGETVPIVTTGVPVYIRSGNSYIATYGFPTMSLSIVSVKEAKEATFKIVARDKENISDIIFESELITVELNQ